MNFTVTWVKCRENKGIGTADSMCHKPPCSSQYYSTVCATKPPCSSQYYSTVCATKPPCSSQYYSMYSYVPSGPSANRRCHLTHTSPRKHGIFTCQWPPLPFLPVHMGPMSYFLNNKIVVDNLMTRAR